jgi:hypothetical protein
VPQSPNTTSVASKETGEKLAQQDKNKIKPSVSQQKKKKKAGGKW